MIKSINNKNKQVAKEIYSIFQSAYKIEAELLNVSDFPPLKRTVNDFITSNNTFFAYFSNSDILAIIEIDGQNISTHIQSLVVVPSEFRKGIGRKLTNYILENYKSQLFTVETGLRNIPAIQLYKSIGFQESKRWKTDHGVIKIRFEKYR